MLVRKRLLCALFALTAALAAAGTGAGGAPARCVAGRLYALGSQRLAYYAAVKSVATAYRSPGAEAFASFGALNVNRVPTVFGVRGAVVSADCTPSWFRVQLPRRPNGVTGFVPARDVALGVVSTRIVVDVSDRRLTLYDRGREVLEATVAVGSAATPTPTGSFYVNQKLRADPAGPFGPGALGISAFSPVLTGWAQGGPVAIHGTNDPGSIGRAVSNGCVRLPNAVLARVFSIAPTGTPVLIRA